MCRDTEHYVNDKHLSGRAPQSCAERSPGAVTSSDHSAMSAYLSLPRSDGFQMTQTTPKEHTANHLASLISKEENQYRIIEMRLPRMT